MEEDNGVSRFSDDGMETEIEVTPEVRDKHKLIKNRMCCAFDHLQHNCFIYTVVNCTLTQQ